MGSADPVLFATLTVITPTHQVNTVSLSPSAVTLDGAGAVPAHSSSDSVTLVDGPHLGLMADARPMSSAKDRAVWITRLWAGS